MADDLPKEFDLVVMGTGFTESCIAAAASRIGKTVLHLDRNEFYGGSWASCNLENLIELLEQKNSNELRNCSYKWNIPETVEEQTRETMILAEGESNAVLTEATLANSHSQINTLKVSRRFNIDLCPKILYAAGSLVQLLISSNICRYAEFRALDHVCTRFHNELLNVPCSRSDVFNSKDLSIVEKRILMKVLNDCLVYGEEKRTDDEINNRGKTFREYLSSQKVTEKISVCIMQAIAMCNNETTFEDGMERTQRFLQSLGRYGNTPFLFPMYGCGEIPQCFCRLCAVFGGIYCLKCAVTDLAIDNETKSIKLKLENGNEVQCKHVVSSFGNLPKESKESHKQVNGCESLGSCLSRGIFITSTPLGGEKFNSGGGGVNLLRLVEGEREAIVIQLSPASGTCPKDYFIFHLTTPALTNDPAKDLEPFVTQIFNGSMQTPQLLFTAYFTLWGPNQSNTTKTTNDIPVYCTAAPYYELDYDRSIENAQDVFKLMYPEADFLPRAPDPEEIIIDGEDPRALSEVSLPEDLKAQLHELEQAAGEMEIDNNEADRPQQMDEE